MSCSAIALRIPKGIPGASFDMVDLQDTGTGKNGLAENATASPMTARNSLGRIDHPAIILYSCGLAWRPVTRVLNLGFASHH
jgi:hypothetical protein